MTEWGVVGVLIALAGFIVTVAKPIISLTKSITELTVVVRELKTDMESQKAKADDAHKALWLKETEHEKMLADHETRIGILEGK